MTIVNFSVKFELFLKKERIEQHLMLILLDQKQHQQCKKVRKEFAFCSLKIENS